MKYSLTDAAEDDVSQIIRYIRVEQKSSQNAKLVGTRLRNHFRLLARHPGIGHTREELWDDSVRVSEVTGLLVIYDPIARPLLVLCVIHASRDLSRIDPYA